jgi:hypothetical protein
MLHHLSFAVHDPLHVAEVVAELWQGKVIPFPGHPNSFIALNLDAYGTAIELLPKHSVLKPATQPDGSGAWIADPTATRYTATHINMAVPISEAQIYAIADREGWRAIRCGRQGFFDLIEFWVENEILLELLPPNLLDQYLTFMQPENVKALFGL